MQRSIGTSIPAGAGTSEDPLFLTVTGQFLTLIIPIPADGMPFIMLCVTAPSPAHGTAANAASYRRHLFLDTLECVYSIV